MTLEEMAIAAARYSDRYDEFEKTENDDGEMEYQDDALHYLNVFRDAINEAYFDVSRNRLSPDCYQTVMVAADGTVDLEALDPMPYSIKAVLNKDRTAAIDYKFQTKFVLEIAGAQPGETITIYYHYMPDRLEGLMDEPVFPESVVDPMVYITLAVARMWLSEKKISLYREWMNEYYAKLRDVKANMKAGNLRRVPRSRYIR